MSNNNRITNDTRANRKARPQGNRPQNRRRVVKYKKKRNINVGIVIFLLIFVYLVSYVIMYISRDKISMYEVVYGKNAESSNKTYSALLLRDEKTYTAGSSGYLNLFVREGEKTAVGETVYTIDESGVVSELLAKAENSENSLSKEELNELKGKINTYSSSYSNVKFSDVYDFKFDIEASVLEYMNLNAISNIDEVLGDNIASSVFRIIQADISGIVSYSIDGYEGKTVDSLLASDFDKSNYSKTYHKSNDLIENGTSIYKVVNSEDWNVIFEISDQDVEKYASDYRMKIKFMEDGISAVGDFKIKDIDGKKYGVVSLNQYMIRYVSKRFTDIQIIEDEIQGLKIPKTSITQKEFFTIPIDYATNGGNSTDTGFLVEVYDDKGNKSTKFVSPEIYNKTQTDYYVSKDIFKAGDIILKPDSTDTFTISNVATLIGVYNINNGYCVFREINIIGETSEYYIVESGTTYGLLVYDHIVLDSSKVSEDQVVYQ